MITTVTLNPAIDKTILVRGFEKGKVNRISSIREDIGGKGINVSKLLNSFGVATKAVGFIGLHNKNKVHQLLEKEYLNYSFIEINELTRTNTKIVDTLRNETTDLNEEGFEINYSNFMLLKENLLKESEKSSFMVFSGSVPKGLTKKAYYELINYVKKNTLTILDADSSLLIEGIKAAPYMIKPNLHELEAAFKVKLENIKDIVEKSKEIIELYNVTIVLVSMGSRGSILITKDIVLKSEPIEIKNVKSTVGAGDFMLAGMIYGIANNYKLSKALSFASACGTLAVTKEGTQSFTMEEVLDIVKQVRITSI